MTKLVYPKKIQVNNEKLGVLSFSFYGPGKFLVEVDSKVNGIPFRAQLNIERRDGKFMPDRYEHPPFTIKRVDRLDKEPPRTTRNTVYNHLLSAAREWGFANINLVDESIQISRHNEKVDCVNAISHMEHEIALLKKRVEEIDRYLTNE